MTLKKMDVDKDGRVSFDDFEETVKNEPLLLEAFGPCLPRAEMLEQFMRNRNNPSATEDNPTYILQNQELYYFY